MRYVQQINSVLYFQISMYSLKVRTYKTCTMGKFGIQTVFRNFFCEQYARQTIQLVGLILELEFGKLEFRPKIQTIVAFFLVVFVKNKCHYMYPIVAFYINAAIGTKKTPLQCLLSSPKSSLPNSTFKKRLNKFERIQCA